MDPIDLPIISPARMLFGSIAFGRFFRSRAKNYSLIVLLYFLLYIYQMKDLNKKEEKNRYMFIYGECNTKYD